MKATLLISGSFLVLFFVSTTHAADKQKKNGESELAKKVLDKFDTNGDGQVDQREQAAARMQKGQRGPGGQGGGPNLQELTKKFDANGNGKLDPDEIKAARAEWEKRAAEKGNKGNGNKGGAGKGPNAGAEQRAAIYFQTMLKQFDANGNGQLEAEEIQAAQAKMQAMQAQMQASRAQRQAAQGQMAKRRPGLRGK